MNTQRKGSSWRRAVQVWLTGWGWSTRIRPLGEAGDDITAIRPDLTLSVEAKNHDALRLAIFVDQAECQAPEDQIPVVVAHRKGRASVEDAYVVMTGRSFRRLLGGGDR